MKRLMYHLFATLGAFLLGTPMLIVFGQGLIGRALVFLPWLALSLLCAVLIRLCKKGRVFLCTLLTPAIFIGVFLYARGLSESYAVFFPSLICAVFVPLHLLLLCQAPGEEYPPTLWHLGIFIYALALFLLRVRSVAPSAPQMHIFACVYFSYVLIALNELSLNTGMAGDKRPSSVMRWRNRLRTVLVAAGLIIAANIRAIGQALKTALIFLRDTIWAIIQWLMPDPTPVQEGGSGGRMDMSALAESAETPRFWVILEQVIRIAALVLAAVLTFFILKKFMHVLAKAVRFLIEQLRRYAGQINNAYEDTVESILDWGEVKRRVMRPRTADRKKAAAIAWNTLSPRESVRMRYKVLRDRGKERPANLTARQVILQKNVSPQAADLYDRARYSSQEISAQDAAEMKELVK